MIDERPSPSASSRRSRVTSRVRSLPLSQTWLDGLAVLLGLALATSAYLGWMSASRAQDTDCDVSVQALD